MAEAAPSYRERYGYLPAVATMLVETVGDDLMLRVVASLGGVRISVGPRFMETSELPALIGQHAAQMIYDRARRDELLHLDIPRMTRTLELRRHERVLRLRAQGVTIAEIATVLGMTERNIYYVLAADRATPDPRQIPFPF